MGVHLQISHQTGTLRLILDVGFTSILYISVIGHKMGLPQKRVNLLLLLQRIDVDAHEKNPDIGEAVHPVIGVLDLDTLGRASSARMHMTACLMW
jgi:hypothetical protein